MHKPETRRHFLNLRLSAMSSVNARQMQPAIKFDVLILQSHSLSATENIQYTRTIKLAR